MGPPSPHTSDAYGRWMDRKAEIWLLMASCQKEFDTRAVVCDVKTSTLNKYRPWENCLHMQLECHSNINVQSRTPARLSSAIRLTGVSKILPSENGEVPYQTLPCLATDWLSWCLHSARRESRLYSLFSVAELRHISWIILQSTLTCYCVDGISQWAWITKLDVCLRYRSLPFCLCLNTSLRI